MPSTGRSGRSDDDLLEKCVNRGFPYLTASGASLAIHVLRSGMVLLTLEHVERRLLGEYVDLPGLSLTLAQAARLVGVDVRETTPCVGSSDQSRHV